MTPERLAHIIALFDRAPRDEKTIAGLELLEELARTKEMMVCHLSRIASNQDNALVAQDAVWSRRVQQKDLYLLHHYERVR